MMQAFWIALQTLLSLTTTLLVVLVGISTSEVFTNQVNVTDTHRLFPSVFRGRQQHPLLEWSLRLVRTPATMESANMATIVVNLLQRSSSRQHGGDVRAVRTLQLVCPRGVFVRGSRVTDLHSIGVVASSNQPKCLREPSIVHLLYGCHDTLQNIFQIRRTSLRWSGNKFDVSNGLSSVLYQHNLSGEVRLHFASTPWSNTPASSMTVLLEAGPASELLLVMVDEEPSCHVLQSPWLPLLFKDVDDHVAHMCYDPVTGLGGVISKASTGLSVQLFTEGMRGTSLLYQTSTSVLCSGRKAYSMLSGSDQPQITHCAISTEEPFYHTTETSPTNAFPIDEIVTYFQLLTKIDSVTSDSGNGSSSVSGAVLEAVVTRHKSSFIISSFAYYPSELSPHRLAISPNSETPNSICAGSAAVNQKWGDDADSTRPPGGVEMTLSDLRHMTPICQLVTSSLAPWSHHTLRQWSLVTCRYTHMSAIDLAALFTLLLFGVVVVKVVHLLVVVYDRRDHN